MNVNSNLKKFSENEICQKSTNEINEVGWCDDSKENKEGIINSKYYEIQELIKNLNRCKKEFNELVESHERNLIDDEDGKLKSYKAVYSVEWDEYCESTYFDTCQATSKYEAYKKMSKNIRVNEESKMKDVEQSISDSIKQISLNSEVVEIYRNG